MLHIGGVECIIRIGGGCWVVRRVSLRISARNSEIFVLGSKVVKIGSYLCFSWSLCRWGSGWKPFRQLNPKVSRAATDLEPYVQRGTMQRIVEQHVEIRLSTALMIRQHSVEPVVDDAPPAANPKP